MLMLNGNRICMLSSVHELTVNGIHVHIPNAVRENTLNPVPQ